MERYKSYRGRRRRTRSSTTPYTRRTDEIARKQAIKLAICFVLLIAAVLLKLVFPEVLHTIGEKITATVNYKEALATLGEGISGERKFTEALAEAFTNAFTTKDAAEDDDVAPVENEENAVPAMAQSNNVAKAASGEQNSGGGEGEEAGKTELMNAIVAAFLEGQEAYSDYAIPAGVTYDMPTIPFDYQKPVEGTVSSSFGYRISPEDDETVRFHYGTDIAAEEGTLVRSFSEGKVIAVGESPTLGKFVVVSHGAAVESLYGHLSAVYASEGQPVTKGQRIGAMGSTGNATDSCLHFELKVSGLSVNPEYYLDWS
ncbi:MAG TPA: M23 family metallopeptidase [Papillibacter sp.]|jgi:murein DD-endopeptidase MepM/ murein hydrolase activator NlpD|nr:M23 family metallopeptidase [Papillibacter sp.]